MRSQNISGSDMLTWTDGICPRGFKGSGPFGPTGFQRVTGFSPRK